MRVLVGWVVTALAIGLPCTDVSADDLPPLQLETSVLWQSPHADTKYDHENLISITALPDGDVVVSGFRDILPPKREARFSTSFLVVHRISPNGQERWQAVLDLQREPYNRSIVIAAPDDGVFLCDGADSIFRLDRDGKTIWRTLKRGGRWLDGCQDLAYHASGLLLVSGADGNSNPEFIRSGLQPVLIAYDAATGDRRWRVPYLPLDIEVEPQASKIIVSDDGIDWWGHATVGIDRELLTSFSYSLRIAPDGQIIEQTAAEIFLDCWESYGAFEAVDGRVYAEFCSLPDYAQSYGPDRLVYWDNHDWTRPRDVWIETSSLTWPIASHRVDDAYPVGSTPGSVTILFPAVPIAYRRSLEDRNRDIWLDLVTVEPERIWDEGYDHQRVRFGVKEGLGWILKGVASPGGRFRLAAGERFFMLIAEPDGAGWNTYRLVEVSIR